MAFEIKKQVNLNNFLNVRATAKIHNRRVVPGVAESNPLKCLCYSLSNRLEFLGEILQF